VGKNLNGDRQECILLFMSLLFVMAVDEIEIKVMGGTE
jgi:hypothetical protein